MAEIGELSFYAESDSDSFLTGSVHYSTDNSDYDGISDRSISPESEVAPYHFSLSTANCLQLARVVKWILLNRMV